MPKTDLAVPSGYSLVPDVETPAVPEGYTLVPDAEAPATPPKGYSLVPDVETKGDLNTNQSGSLVIPAATGGTPQVPAPKEQVEGPASSSSEPGRPSFFARVAGEAEKIAGRVPGINLGIATTKMLPSLVTGAQKSFAQQQVDIETAKGAFGYETPEQAAANVLREQQDVAQYQYEKEVEDALLKFSQIPSRDIAKQIGWYATNGKALGAQIGESAAGMTNSLAMSLGLGAAGSLAGPIGTVAGAATGAGLGSAVSEASASLLDYAAKQGIDIESSERLRNFFANPEMVSKAKQYAATRGVAIGVVDGIASLFAAKGLGKAVADPLATWVTGKAATVAAKKASLGELGVNTAVDAVGGGGGEILAGALTDGVDWKDVLAEVVVGGIAGVPGTLYETGIAQSQRAGRAPTEEEILASAGGIPESGEAAPVSYEEAIAQGRMRFGWYEGGSEELQVGTYEEAEAKAAQGDIRRGAIFAVKPEDVKASTPIEATELATLISAGDVTNIAAKFDPAIQTATPITKKELELARDAALAEAKNPQWVDTLATANYILRKLVPVYRADTGTAVRVIPRERNLLHDTELSGADSMGGFLSGYTAGTHVDLDVLRGELEALGGKIIPAADNIIDIFKKLGGMETLRNIFNLTPHAETVLSNPKLSETDIAALIDSKDMEWKTGRYDERALVRGFRLAGPNGVFTPQEIAELRTKAQTTISTGTRGISLDPQAQTVRATFNPPKVYDKLGLLFTGTSTVQTASKDPITQKLGKWLEVLQSKLETTKTRIYLVGTDFKDTSEFRNLRSINHPLATALAEEIQTAKFDRNWAGFHLYSAGANVSFIWVDNDPARSSTSTSIQSQYKTLAHEYGHHLSATLYARLPLEVQLRLQGAWRRWLQDTRITSPTEKQAWLRRRFGLGGGWGAGNIADADHQINQVLGDTNYFFSFEEFFAEQVARWATTDRRPLGLLSKFYKEVARKIILVFRELQKVLGAKIEGTFRPEAEFDNWLQSLYYGRAKTDWFASHKSFTDDQTKARNEKFFGSLAMPMQPETAPFAQVMKAFAGGPKGPFGMQASTSTTAPRLLAQIDRFNKFLKWAINFRQLADLNPHIRELQEYREWMELSKLDTAKIMVKAEERVKRWKKLPVQQGAALNDFLFAMNRMEYLSPAELQAGIRRWPTPGEFATLVQQYGLAADTLALYNDIKGDFLEVINRNMQLQIMAAYKLTDLQAQQKAILEAQTAAARMAAGPYFPQTRFGKFSLTVRDMNGRLEHFELFETNRELKAAIKLALQAYPPGQWTITPSTISEEVKPYIGVPSWMLDKLFSMPNVTPTQKQWLEQLRYMLAPQRSFAKHMLKKKNYTGFSLDGRRAYASYFFHHARNYSRIKYQDQLLGTIDALAKSAPTNHDIVVEGAYKRNMMADFLRKAYEDYVNPGNDWAAIRSIVAIWYLGAVPASALLNLFQTPLVSFNYASSKFGAAKAAGAFMRTTKDFKTYYKKGTLAGITAGEMRALARAVEMGKIDESMAAELAATAVGSGNWIGRTYAGDKLKSGWLQVADKSMFMFRMAEQGNRRITFRTFYKLAMENPTNPWLDTLEQKYFLEFQELIQAGYTVREARAYLAGKDSVDTTHYTYDRDSRPAFMRGKQSVLFAFYMFTQNTVFMLYNNPQTAMRWALMMALVAGVRGLVPDDVEDMIKAIGAKLGWNVEEEARRFVSELIGDESELATDLVMNGAGRYSFGIPALMEMAGANGVPTFDLSRMLAFQRVLPINPAALFEPGKEWNEKLAKATEGAAGAAFGIPIAVAKAMNNSDLDILDAKRWEGAMPRALRLGARTFRQAVEGGERDKNYNQYLEYDLSVPEDVGNLIGKAMGFTPTGEAIKWDEQQMMREAQGFWQIRRELLLREAYEELHVRKDKEEYRNVLKKVRDFNQQTPDKKLTVSGDTLKKSFTAKIKRKLQVERGDNPFVNPQMEDRVKTLFPQSEEVERKKVK